MDPICSKDIIDIKINNYFIIYLQFSVLIHKEFHDRFGQKIECKFASELLNYCKTLFQ